MKITKVEVFRLPTANSKQNSPIGCRIHTDVGICGDGEAGMAYGLSLIHILTLPTTPYV